MLQREYICRSFFTSSNDLSPDKHLRNDDQLETSLKDVKQLRVIHKLGWFALKHFLLLTWKNEQLAKFLRGYELLRIIFKFVMQNMANNYFHLIYFLFQLTEKFHEADRGL